MIRRVSHRDSSTRRGIAAVEFAVCLPVLVLVVFGSIEACTMVFLKEGLTVTAFEGSRVALKPGMTAADVSTQCQQILTARNISGATIQVQPGTLASVPSGDPITVTVSAPCGANAVMPVWFYGSTSLAGTAVVMKEY